MRCFVKALELVMVKREKFLEDAKAEPARIYRTPNDVLRDRRLTNGDRREILSAWERKIADDQCDGEPELVGQVQRALQELGQGDDERQARRDSTV
jgi:hypothetical protein